jgi:hypothetical protein
MTVCEDPPSLVFGRGEVGVGAKGDSEGPPAKVFGGGEVGVDTEGDGKGPPTKFVGEGLPKKDALAEAMLVKSLKMMAKPVMPEVMPM